MPGLLPCKLVETPASAAPSPPVATVVPTPTTLAEPACQVIVLDKQPSGAPATAACCPAAAPPKEDTVAVCTQLLETLIVRVEELRNVQSSLKEQQPPLAAPGAAAPAPRRAKIKVTPTRAQMTGAGKPPFGRPLPTAKSTVAAPSPPPTAVPSPTRAVASPVTVMPPAVSVSISPVVTISPTVTVTPVAATLGAGGRRPSADMTLPCSLPLNKVSQLLDTCRPGAAPAAIKPTIPPMLAAGGLEIVPMDSASSMPPRTFGVEKPAIAAPSISLSPNVSLSLAPRAAGPDAPSPVRREPSNPVVSVTVEPEPRLVAPVHPKLELLSFHASQDYVEDSQDSQDSYDVMGEELGGAVPKGEVDIDDMFEAKEEPITSDGESQDSVFNSVSLDQTLPAVIEAKAQLLDESAARRTGKNGEVARPSRKGNRRLEEEVSESTPVLPEAEPTAPAPGALSQTDEDGTDGDEREWDEYQIPIRSTRSGKPLEPVRSGSPSTKLSRSRKSRKVSPSKTDGDADARSDDNGPVQDSRKENRKGARKTRKSDIKKPEKKIVEPELQPEVEGGFKSYQFTIGSEHHYTGPSGEKWYKCDICMGVHQRAFSLKRHYLRCHINYSHLSERDIINSGIVVANKAPPLHPKTSADEISSPESGKSVGSANSSEVIGGLYQCFTCNETFNEIPDIREHLSNHRQEQQLVNTSLSDGEVDLPSHDGAPTLEPAVESEPTSFLDAAPTLFPAPSSASRPAAGESNVMKPDVIVSNELMAIDLDTTIESCVVCNKSVTEDKESGLSICGCPLKTADDGLIMCFFCEKLFASDKLRRQHQSRTHQRPTKKVRKAKIRYSCSYCINVEPVHRNLDTLFEHMCVVHNGVFFGCVECERRFPNKDTLLKHQKSDHNGDGVEENLLDNEKTSVIPPSCPSESTEDGVPSQQSESGTALVPGEQPGSVEDGQFKCSVCFKYLASEINLNRHYRLKHDNRGKKKKKKAGSDSVPASDETKKDVDKMDPETLFYSQISTNIRDNLLHHLDGKLDSQELFEREVEQAPLVQSSATPHLKTPTLSIPSTSQDSSQEIIPPLRVKHVGRRRSSDGYRTWEKYAFPKKYDGKGGMKNYLRDMSHVDIYTQVMMRQNAMQLKAKDAQQSPTPSTSSGATTRSYNLRSSHEEVPMLDFPSVLSLTQSAAGIHTRKTASSAVLEKSMLSVSFNPPDLPKPDLDRRPKPPKEVAADFLNAAWRQGSLPMVNGCAELSGEWVRSKNYICGACEAKFRNLYDLEDHKWNFHPNVWCTHFEFDDAALIPFAAVGIKSPGDLHRRSIRATGTIVSAPAVPAIQQCDMTCTKCQHVCHSAADFHRHILDCGGDTTWQLMMAGSPGSSGNRRNRKWRPFGSRRRRPQGRRGLKRNIPNTPQRPRTNNPKTRGGDAETIQKMIANLPAKRTTRRVIQFKEDEIKTRSQATMASTRLLRKRFKGPFPVSHSALHKASRALVDRSKAASSSKPGHMPKARPLRSQGSAGATASTSSATSTFTAPSTSAATAASSTSGPSAQDGDADVSLDETVPDTWAASKGDNLPETDEDQAASSKGASSVEASGDRGNVTRRTTILEAMKLAMLDSDSDNPVERKKSLRSEKMSMEMQVQAMELEDAENALKQRRVPPSSMKDIHLPPAPSLELTTVQLLAKTMRPNFCAGCQRTFCNNSNRDRHLKVCPFLLQIAGDGIPKLRKELEYRNHPLNLNNLHQNPMEYSHRTGATSEDMPKQPESPDKDKSLSNEVSSGKRAATGNKKSKDSKKQQVVGIRKRVVPSESPDGGIVVKETVLVRVNSSSSETVDNETGEKSEDSSDSESTANDDSIVNALRNKKLRRSDNAGKLSTKPQETTDSSGDPSSSDSRITRRSGRGSVLPDEGAEIIQGSNSVIDEDDIPLHKFTRSRNSSPLKVPVVRVDRSSRSADKRESFSAAEVNLRSTRQASTRTNSPKKTASDVLDDDADYDTDEFEELLDKMEPEEIKKLDFLSQVLEGDDSGSSDDDLPLVAKQKVVENFSSDDDLPLKPKSNSAKTVPVETSKADTSDDEESPNNVKRTGRKKSSGTPIKKLQEIATSMAESLSDLQSSISKTKGKAKKSKSNEEDLSPPVAAPSVPPIKVIVKVPRNKTVTDLSEDDVSPTRRRSLRSRELPDLEQELASESPSTSARKRSKGEVSQTSEVPTKDQLNTRPNEVPDEETKMPPKQSKKRTTKPISDHSIQNDSTEVNDTQPTTESEASQSNMKEGQKNADMSKSKKKAKPPTFLPVPIPEPNLETVVELDPNLIGELTPRLSRKRFKELSSTSTPLDSSKPSQDTESTISASKTSKKKVKAKSSETPEEAAQENPVHDVSSKSFKAKHRTAKSPVTPTEAAPVSTSKSKKKSKGKADSDKPEIDEEKTASASVKSLPNKITSKKGTHSTPNPEQVEGRILTRRKFPWEESLEELANVAPGGAKGKRLKLDENLADSADNDSVVTGSDVSEVSKSSRRSRSRGLENTADFSETESTLLKAETEVQSRLSKRNKKGKSSSKSSKRKSKAKIDNEPGSEHGEETKPADVSLEDTEPSSKRLKKDVGENQIDKEESNTTTLNSDHESNQNAFESDAAQFPSETAAVPASSLCQNPPVAASPTPAEAPESPKKSSKKGKIPAQENFCQVCLRYYSTQYNLYKHYASSYHKSSVEAKAKENASKGGDISDLLNAAPEKPVPSESNERVEEAPTAADGDASVQMSEQTLAMESSQKKIINKQSEVDNVSQENVKSTEIEHVAQDESSPENSIPQPATVIPSHEDKNKSVPSSMESNQSASSETSSSEKEVEGNANTGCQVPSDSGLPNVPQDSQTCSESQQYNQSHFEQHSYDGSHYQQPFNQSHYQPPHQYGQSQQYDQPQSSLQYNQQDGHQPHTANQPFGQEQSQDQQNQSSYNQSQVESSCGPLDPIPSQPQDTTPNYEQQPQHFNHQELSQSQTAPHQSNELYDLQPRQQSEEQHQSYNNYNSADSWQSSDCGWGGPWRAPDITPSYAADDGSIGLGSILDSVNQVLSGDGGISMSDVPMYADYASLSDLQHAIGANDEEMAVLRQLGEGSLRELIGPPPSAHPDEAEFLDLDNQKKAAERQACGPSTSTESNSETRRVNPFISTGRHGGSSKGSGKGSKESSRTKGLLSSGPTLNELYEDKQMWCPFCHRRFLGLAAMKAHMDKFHTQSSDAGKRVERRSVALSAEGSSEPRLCCSLCKEMVADEKALRQHHNEMHIPGKEPHPKPSRNSDGLRTQMSSALGGLLDRALKSYLSKASGPNANANPAEADKSRLTLGILSKLALRHQSGNLNLNVSPTGGVCIGTLGGATGSTTDMLVGQLVAAKLGMRRGSGSSRRRGSGDSSSGTIDPSFICHVCNERFPYEGAMKRHMAQVHRRADLQEERHEDRVIRQERLERQERQEKQDDRQEESSLSATDSRPDSPVEMSMEPAVGLDGTFLCSVCGINYKTPIEVLEHQRLEHSSSRRSSREEDVEVEVPVAVDAEAAEKATAWIENHTKLQSSPKGRHPLGKDVKNRKVAIAVESALLEKTEEMRIKAEAALRELNQTRKPTKGSSKEAKWGVDAVKFTVTKEAPLVGAYGPTLENETRKINIPVVRKAPNNTSRFSFSKKSALAKGGDAARSEEEKIDVYDFDDVRGGPSRQVEDEDMLNFDDAPPEQPKKRKRAPKKDSQTKKAAEASDQAQPEKDAVTGEGVLKPKRIRIRKPSSKKAKATAETPILIAPPIGVLPNSTTSSDPPASNEPDSDLTPTLLQLAELAPAYLTEPNQALQVQLPQSLVPQPESSLASLAPVPALAPAPAQAPAPVPVLLPRDPLPLTPVQGTPKDHSEVGKSSRSPRGAKASLKTGLSVFVQEEQPLPPVATRAPRRASLHDVTDYSVFDFSSDESTDEELLIHPDVPTPSARSRTRLARPPAPSRPSSSASPKKATVSSTRPAAPEEEDWTWLDEDSDEFEREVRQQRSARRKRARRAAKSESHAQVTQKHLLKSHN